jgi:ketosteroid isomerase-like protein
MRICVVATTSMLMACAVLAGCAKEETRLPESVTMGVTRDFNKGDAMSTAAHYADDAEILPPRNPVIQGRPAIAAFFQANIDKYIGYGNVTTWSAVRGDIAVEQGSYNVRNVKVGQDVEAGKYLRIWKRIGGDWKLYRDMYSPDSALTQSVLVSSEDVTPGENAATR